MKRTILLLGFIASIGMLRAQETAGNVSSSQKHKKSKKSKRAVSSEKLHYGTASFYANKFEGRKTATGEIFTQKKMTGASNILPLNHWVRVTNTRNNLSVILRINDRMHKNNKRLIDLSKSAAKKLKYTGYGLAHVKVEVLGKKPPGEYAQY
ncbi:MAG TPA: septal ring lytic transglycosylase RlpA family protein [Puia sp.]|nr:septal ring lytic transglycosylase RlpA family protein [Puia sp.]